MSRGRHFLALAVIIGVIALGATRPGLVLLVQAALVVAVIAIVVVGVVSFRAGRALEREEHRQRLARALADQDPVLMSEADAYKAAMEILEPFDYQARLRVLESLSRGVVIKQHEASIQREKRGPVRVGTRAQ